MTCALKGFIAIHCTSVLDENFHQERRSVSAFAIHQVGAPAKGKNGVALRCHVDGCQVIVPSGCISVNASAGGTYLRWGIYCHSSVLARVGLMLGRVL